MRSYRGAGSTFGISLISRFHCCGHHGHGLWPSWSWFVAVTVVVVMVYGRHGIGPLYSVRVVTFTSQVSISPGSFACSLSKLLTYCVLGPTQPPTLSGMGNE